MKRRIVAWGYVRGPRLVSWLRQRWVILRNPVADISFGHGCYLGPGFSIHAPWGGTFRAGDWCEFRRGFRLELAGPDSRVEAGHDCVFTYDVLIQCARSIRIGNASVFGQANQLVDGNHRFRDLTQRAKDQGYDLRPIEIGDNVMVMSKCTVVNDVGDRAFIGANSVVSKKVPAHCLAVGAPAKVIDYFGPAGGEPSGWPPSD